MCLTRIMTNREKLNVKYEKEGPHNVGWKLFRNYDEALKSYWVTGKDLPEGKWINEKDFRGPYIKSLKTTMDYHEGVYYKPGFHVWIKKLGYKANYSYTPVNTFRKVWFRKVLEQGFDNGYETIVVEEIFIHPY